jgi:hypothetical protein
MQLSERATTSINLAAGVALLFPLFDVAIKDSSVKVIECLVDDPNLVMYLIGLGSIRFSFESFMLRLWFTNLLPKTNHEIPKNFP